MNVYLNKDFLKFKKINNRYLKFNEKSERQTNISENINKFNKHNMTKLNNVYNSNYFSVNKTGKNNNIHVFNKKENNLKLSSLANQPKVYNSNKNIELYITNFKNSNSKLYFNPVDIKQKKDENKMNNNLIKNDNETPTLLKIQKLIEALQTNHHTIDNTKNMNAKNKLSFDSKTNNAIKKIDSITNKRNDKLPSLINDIETTFKTKENEIIGQGIFPLKDMINRVNHTKIKLKNINHNSFLVHKNKNKDEKSKNIIIKAKDLPKPKPRIPKVSTNKIKNVIKDNLIINNNGYNEKIVNIRLKSDNKNKFYYFNPSVYQNNSLSQIKTKKDSFDFCISNYNNFKSNLMVLKQTFHNMEDERTRKEKFFNKNQTMFKNPLKEKKLKEENEDNESIEEDSKRFSKYFLPSSGFGLLQKHTIYD